jgi:hypothetical protein
MILYRMLLIGLRRMEFLYGGINENPKQKEWTSSPKIFANIYIDDTALGIPLKLDEDGHISRPYVDWNRVRALLKIKGVL